MSDLDFDIDLGPDLDDGVGVVAPPASGTSGPFDPVEPATGIPLPHKFGDFTLVRLLGVGGMAEVFLAEREGVGGFSKTLVVKRILPRLAADKKFVDMLMREARTVSKLIHTNIVQVLELGMEGDQCFIAMEYVDGLSLQGLANVVWAAGHSLPLEVILRAAADAALGLHAAHQARDASGRLQPIVHRDVSPDNLMLSREGVTKVLDFGVAKVADDQIHTETGVLKGKVPFMSPEQIRSEPLDGRADLYALGVTMFWLLTSRRPFDDSDDFATLKNALNTAAPDVRSLNPQVPAVVADLVNRLLAKGRGDRPVSGLLLHDELVAISPTQESGARDFITSVMDGRLSDTSPSKTPTGGHWVAARPLTTAWKELAEGNPLAAVGPAVETPAVPVLGIDLGTTNTSAAWIDEQGYLELVDFGDEEFLLPSAVSYRVDGAVLVGKTATALLADEPDSTLHGFKRFVGRRFASEFVARNRHRVAYSLVAAEDGYAAFEVFDQQRSLLDPFFHLLSRVREMANISAGLSFTECVVTVPAHFTFRQRQLVRQAAERLFSVRALINEPTAAAIFYGTLHNADTRLLVFDLGGGTFDATVLEVAENHVRVLATGGDAFLGGEDFDFAIARELANRYEHKFGIDILSHPHAAQRVIIACERAKIELSEHKTTQVRVAGVAMKDGLFLDLDEPLTRADLERVTAPLIEKALGIAEETVARTGLTGAAIGECVLVGGQTKMPAIRDRLSQRYNVDAEGALDVAVGVAMGAAQFANSHADLKDVLSLPLNVAVPGGAPQLLVASSTALPVEVEVPIAPRPAPGLALTLVMFEAISLTSVERDLLGTVTIPGPWLAANDGALTLHASLDAAATLSLTCSTASGATIALTIEERREPPQPPPQIHAVGKRPMGAVAARVSARLPIMIREASGTAWMEAEVIDLSETGAFVSTTQPFKRRTPVVVMMTGLRLHALVVKVATPDAATVYGPGMALHFSENDAAAQVGLKQLLAGAADLSASGAESARPEAVSADMVPTLERFIRFMRDGTLYEALDVDPPSSTEQLREALARISRHTAELENAPEDMRERMAVAEGLLLRAERVLLDDDARLVYDLRAGHLRLKERLQEAGDDPQQIDRLRSAWRRAHPESAQRSSKLTREAVSAFKLGATGVAIRYGRRAVSLDPFHLKLRRTVSRWVASAVDTDSAKKT